MAGTREERVMKKQEEKRQENILEDFFQETKSYNMSVELGFVVGFFEFIAGAMICLPYQDMANIAWGAGVLALEGGSFYMQGFLMTSENGKQHAVCEKMKYLPVSIRNLRRWCFKKLVEFCGKGTLVFLGLQLFFSLVCYHELTLGNFLYPLLAGFVVPVIIGALQIMGQTRVK